MKDTNLGGAGAGPSAGQVISYTGSQSAGILAMSPAKAAFGALGGIAMAETGKQIVRDNAIHDPAPELARMLAAELASKEGAQLAASPAPIDHSGMLIPSPAKVAAGAAGAQFVVDVETQNWGFAYYSTDWGHYHVLYGARVRLVDARSQAIVAEHFCAWDSNSSRPRLTTDDMLNNKASGLKQLFGEGAASCANEFRTVLGLPTQTARASAG